MLQNRISVASPGHGFPRVAPEGLYSHTRVLEEVPFPHDLLHGENADQVFQTPSTENYKKNF